MFNIHIMSLCFRGTFQVMVYLFFFLSYLQSQFIKLCYDYHFKDVFFYVLIFYLNIVIKFRVQGYTIVEIGSLSIYQKTYINIFVK